MSLIYLWPQICGSFWCQRNAADLTDIFLCAQLHFEDDKNCPEQISPICDSTRRSVQKGDDLEQSQALDKTVVSHRKHIIPVESSENRGGGEGFESGTQAPHDCPCEQRPPSSLPWTLQRFKLPLCDE